MKRSRVAILVIGALVAGLTLGGIGIASAANRQAQTNAAYAGTMIGGTSPVAVLAKLTGLSVQDIMALHTQETSFAQIASDNGVDPSAVVDQVVAARQAQLDSLVAAGTMTAAQEQAILDRMRAAVETMLNAAPMGANGSRVATFTPGPGVMTTPTVGPRGTGGMMGTTTGRTTTGPRPRHMTSVAPVVTDPGTTTGPIVTTPAGPPASAGTPGGMMGGSTSGMMGSGPRR